MAYYPTYSYTYSSSSGWDYDVHVGTSSHSYVWGDSHAEEPIIFSTPLHANDWDIPISRDSTLAGAVTPTNLALQGEVQPPRPTSQQVQHQPAQLVNAQPIQLVSSHPVVPPRLGVQTQHAAPQPAANRCRAAYVLANPPARHPRQPVGTTKFCQVGGCERWTRESGKKLGRHRASHFPGQVGVTCPGCNRFFSRSSACGKHLKRCNRQLWDQMAAVRGSQDSWGQKIGQDLINRSLVDRAYIPQDQHEL